MAERIISAVYTNSIVHIEFISHKLVTVHQTGTDSIKYQGKWYAEHFMRWKMEFYSGI